MAPTRRRRVLCTLPLALAGALWTPACARDTSWMDMSVSMLTLGGDRPCYIFLRGETTLEQATTCLTTSAPPGREHARVRREAGAPDVVEVWTVWPDADHRLTVRFTFHPGADNVPRIQKVEFGPFVHVAPTAR